MEWQAMSIPKLESIKTSTEKAVSRLDWLVEVLRAKNWVPKLLLLEIILLAFLNPYSVSQILETLPIALKLPSWYPLAFGSICGLVFLAALIIRWHTRPAVTLRIDFTKRSAIKGLRPFAFEDAELFADMERQQELRKWLEAITSADFRFGVLFGESGCGKTSFLQAGLWPRLKQQPAIACVYVKFSKFDPLDVIRQALTEQTPLPKDKVEGADLLTLLKTATQTASKTMVLLFDQFEQFFVHRKLDQEREPFVQALAGWYQRNPSLPVKILIGVRGDFLDRMHDLYGAMGYSPVTDSDCFRLDRFTPQQTAAIFRVIAENERIDLDEAFVDELAAQELASREDGRVSAVDIQIIAWMLGGQATTERAFNREAYYKLGGVEGLIERFVLDTLQARETDARRQVALKVLLALTDLERNARAGLLSLEDLRKRLAGTVPDSEVEEAVAWLARGVVRLITPNKQNDILRYELAHERLIPAVCSLAGKVLTATDRANQLLGRRVNEWLGNQRASRYLFSWRELRLIRSQRPYLHWGPNKTYKEALVSASQRRLRFRRGGACFVVLLLMLIFASWNSPWGQAWLADRELLSLRARIHDPYALSSIAELYTVRGQWPQALGIVEEITDPHEKGYALGELTLRASWINDREQARTLRAKVLRFAAGIRDAEARASALSEIAWVSRFLDKENANAVWAEVLEVAAGIQDKEARTMALSAMIRTTTRGIFNEAQAQEVWAKTIQVAEAIEPREAQIRALSAVATAFAAQPGADNELWMQALRMMDRIRDPETKARVLIDIVHFAPHTVDAGQARTMWIEVVQVAQGIGISEAKAQALNAVVTTMAGLAASRNDGLLWASTLQVIDDITEPIYQARALLHVGGVAAGDYYLGRYTRGTWTHIADIEQVRGYFARARAIAEAIRTPEMKVTALKEISKAENKNAAMKGVVALAAMPYAGSTIMGITESLAAHAEAYHDVARWTQAAQVAKKNDCI